MSKENSKIIKRVMRSENHSIDDRMAVQRQLRHNAAVKKLNLFPHEEGHTCMEVKKENNYDIYCYNREKFSSVNLGSSSKEVIEAVYNICRFLFEEWDTTEQETKEEFEKLVNYFENPDEILPSVITLKERDMENLPVLALQIATFRFLRVHLLQIRDTLENKDWKHSSIRWKADWKQVEEWEVIFWLIASGQAEKESDPPKKHGYDPYFIETVDLEGVVKSAMEYKDIVEQIRQLQQEYEPYILKAEKLNYAAQQYTKEQREEKLAAIKSMKKIVDMLEKNLSGELTASDIVKTENHFSERKRALENLAETVNELFGCSHPAKQQ